MSLLQSGRLVWPIAALLLAAGPASAQPVPTGDPGRQPELSVTLTEWSAPGQPRRAVVVTVDAPRRKPATAIAIFTQALAVLAGKIAA